MNDLWMRKLGKSGGPLFPGAAIGFWLTITLLGCMPETAYGATREYSLVISNGIVNPDSGGNRTAVLINGQLGGPLISVAPGDVLKVNVTNRLSEGYAGDFGEISVHWHGFSMRGVPYLDGTGFMSQCPILKNSSMEYEFTVKELPGTYMYHEHTSVLVADGLAGGLLVTGGDDAAINAEYNVQEENNKLIILSEWFNETGPSLAKPLNRPFPTGSETEEGQSLFQWVGTPRSLLMNYQGCQMDCNGIVNNKTKNQNCKPDPECTTRYSLTVEPDTSYRIRLIGAGSLLYQIVCFEGHNLTLVATDARQVEPLDIGNCVDVNLGQRMDVILKTMSSDSLKQQNQTAFWITGRASGRTGMPASYGVLNYKDSKKKIALPPSDPPQPADVPESWSTTDFVMNITSPRKLVPDYVRSEEPGRRLLLEVAQPIMQQTSQIRWAISNVVFLETPSCNNTLAQTKDPEWLSPSNPYLIESADEIAQINITDIPGLGQQTGSGEAFVFLNLNFEKRLMPKEPVAGTPLIETQAGDIIDVLVQNNPAEAFGGIILNRTSSEEHPIHLHGHHFWVLGSGQGNFIDLEKNFTMSQLLNFENPRQADTATLPAEGWIYLRFKANNPGVWPIHCHIAWHEFMGQLVLFAEDVDNIPATPEGVLPQCKAECVYNAAPYASTQSDTASQVDNEQKAPAPGQESPAGVAPASSATLHTYASIMVLSYVLHLHLLHA